MLRSKKRQRVQVNVSSDMYQQLRKISFQNRVSISEVIRQSLVESGKVELRGEDGDQDKKMAKWIKKYVGRVRGRKDDSVTHDIYVGRTGGWR